MINHITNFLNKDEISYFIGLYNDDTNPDYMDGRYYRFHSIDLIKKNIISDKFKHYGLERFRVQMLNETVNQFKINHIHISVPFSFVIFLNNDFEGGELIFNDDDIYTPTPGDMIFFTGDEPHRVNNCIGNRYTLVGFCNNNPHYNYIV